MQKSILRILLFITACVITGIGILTHFQQRKIVPTNTTQKLRIVCTTNLIGDAVQQIAGSDVTVQTLMGPGVDPHLYKPRERDVHVLASANIIFYNGLHLEGKMTDIFKSMQSRTKTVAVTDGIDQRKLRKTNFDNVYDPHVWFDINLWIDVVQYIGTTLSNTDPAHATTYAQRAAIYIEHLKTLDQYVRKTLDTIPSSQRILITAHDAFGYFGTAYGFDVIGLQGISTETEPGIKDINNLAQLIVHKKIKAIFAETSIPQRSLIAVQNAVNAAGWNVILGPALYSDSLGATDGNAGTYIAMVQHNVNTIVTSLAP